MTAKPKRRWYQFSLRAMLVVLTFLCFPLGWLAYERNVVRRRDAAVAASKTLGGRLEFDPSEHSRPAWLRPLLGDDAAGEAVSASFTGTKVTDEDLAYVARLKRLKVLYLCDTQVTDAGLAHLTGLTELRFVWLDRTGVTDVGFGELRKTLPKFQLAR